MSERIMKALANCEQGLNNEQKLQARTNIGAIGGVKVTDASGTTELVPDEDGKVTVDLTNATQVQSDWTESDPTSKAFILHKPNLATVATSGSYTDLSNKPTIPAAQVQSDWAQSDSSQVDYIKNKPAAMQTKPLVAGTNIQFVSESDRVSINTTASKVTTTSTSSSEPVTSPVTELNLNTTDLSVSTDATAVGFLAPESLATGSGDVDKVLTCYKDYLDNTHYRWSSISREAQLMLGYSSAFNTFSSTATVGNNWTRMTLEATPIKFNPITQTLGVQGFFYFDINVQMLGCCPGGPGNGKSVALGFEVEGINCTVAVAYPNYSSTVTYDNHLLYTYTNAMDSSGDIDSHFKGVFQIINTSVGNHSVYVHVWFRTTSALDNVFTIPTSVDAVMHACPPWYTYTNRLASNSVGRAAGSAFRM